MIILRKSKPKMADVPAVSVSKILKSLQEKSKTKQSKAPIRHHKNKFGRVAKVVQELHANEPE